MDISVKLLCVLLIGYYQLFSSEVEDEMISQDHILQQLSLLSLSQQQSKIQTTPLQLQTQVQQCDMGSRQQFALSVTLKNNSSITMGNTLPSGYGNVDALISSWVISVTLESELTGNITKNGASPCTHFTQPLPIITSGSFHRFDITLSSETLRELPVHIVVSLTYTFCHTREDGAKSMTVVVHQTGLDIIHFLAPNVSARTTNSLQENTIAEVQ